MDLNEEGVTLQRRFLLTVKESRRFSKGEKDLKDLS